MNGQELRGRWLLSLYRSAMAAGVSKFFDIKQLADEAGLPYAPGQLRLIAQACDEQGAFFISAVGRSETRGYPFALTVLCRRWFTCAVTFWSVIVYASGAMIDAH